jgi:hypothetical protein
MPGIVKLPGLSVNILTKYLLQLMFIILVILAEAAGQSFLPPRILYIFTPESRL